MTLRYSDDGPSDKPCVLFLHAFPYHSGMWDAQRAALADLARTITVDARGVREPGAPAAYMFEQLVDDVLALLDRLDISRAILCGLSMGGYVALRTAERAPERVKALFLADTQAAPDDNAAKLARAAAVRTLNVGASPEFVEAQLKRALSAETHAQRPSHVAVARGVIEACSPAALAAALVALATRTDTRNALPGFRMPTCIVVGEHDAITPVAVARELAEAIPRADQHVIPGAGHLSNLEAPGAFNEILRDFVVRVR
jgi:3-oxoadipate enol-lactonase